MSVPFGTVLAARAEVRTGKKRKSHLLMSCRKGRPQLVKHANDKRHPDGTGSNIVVSVDRNVWRRLFGGTPIAGAQTLS
jgi:hypothetical protein